MALPGPLAERPSWPRLDAAMILGGSLLLIAVLAASSAMVDQAGERLTRNTVRLSLAWYALALCVMMQLEPADWAASSLAGRMARWCWTWALACFLVHVAVAVHYYHNWSHADALERTRMVSGVGQGLYASYLFAVLWTADVMYWWLRGPAYAGRWAWIDWALHAFMLFIVFNSTVIFAQGTIRWAGVLMFVILLAVWLGRRFARPPAP